MMALLALLGCVDINTLQKDMKEAERLYASAASMEAQTCTPEEFAMAQAHLEFTRLEFQQGDPHRAREHLDIALENARVAATQAPLCLPQDRDGDGIEDDIDLCPDEPEDMDGVADDDGCPDLNNDSDGDGLMDDVDECPREPEDLDGFRDGDGCPDLDNDKDGVVDARDDCPMEPEDIDGFEDSDGCPDRDNDKDGFADSDDACPDTPGPKDGCPERDADGDGFLDDADRCPYEAGVAPDGCPTKDFDGDGILDSADMCPGDAGPAPTGCPDRDGDGIVDKQDRCPMDAENFNEYMDTDGCPDTKPQMVKIKHKQIVISEQIQFETGKAVIQPVSYPILDDVVQVMSDYPQIEVRIEGHTDNVGSDATNMKLSKDRADSVFEYLIAQGVDPRRLSTEGFGETRPIDTNKTPQGRAANRRVEFHITKGLDD